MTLKHRYTLLALLFDAMVDAAIRPLSQQKLRYWPGQAIVRLKVQARARPSGEKCGLTLFSNAPALANGWFRSIEIDQTAAVE